MRAVFEHVESGKFFLGTHSQTHGSLNYRKQNGRCNKNERSNCYNSNDLAHQLFSTAAVEHSLRY